MAAPAAEGIVEESNPERALAQLANRARSQRQYQATETIFQKSKAFATDHKGSQVVVVIQSAYSDSLLCSYVGGALGTNKAKAEALKKHIEDEMMDMRGRRTRSLQELLESLAPPAGSEAFVTRLFDLLLAKGILASKQVEDAMKVLTQRDEGTRGVRTPAAASLMPVAGSPSFAFSAALPLISHDLLAICRRVRAYFRTSWQAAQGQAQAGHDRSNEGTAPEQTRRIDPEVAAHFY